MEFVRIGAIAVLGVMLGLMLKSGKQEYGLYTGIGICLLIFSYTVSYMGQMKEQLLELFSYLSSGSRYFPLLLRVAGIAWLSEFVSGICKDSGFSAVASQVELLGKILILFSGIPVFAALMETISNFAG